MSERSDGILAAVDVWLSTPANQAFLNRPYMKRFGEMGYGTIAGLFGPQDRLTGAIEDGLFADFWRTYAVNDQVGFVFNTTAEINAALAALGPEMAPRCS